VIPSTPFAPRKTNLNSFMKKFSLAVYLALAGSGFLAPTAKAGTYQTGDVEIGFVSTSGSVTEDYYIDIGQSLFANAALHGGTVTIGNFSTDLSNFDSTWATDGTVYWGVAGNAISGDNSKTLYAGFAETTSGGYPTVKPGSSYNGAASGTQQTRQGSISGPGAGYNTGGSLIAQSSVGDDQGYNFTGYVGQMLEVASSSNPQSWRQGVGTPTGSGFGVWAGFNGNINFTGSPSAGTSLDYYQIQTLSSPVYEGTFNISSTGTITFSTSPVPEPSALTALVGGVGLLLGCIRRRRSVTA